MGGVFIQMEMNRGHGRDYRRVAGGREIADRHVRSRLPLNGSIGYAMISETPS